MVVLVVAAVFAWPMLRPAPEVAQPDNLAQLRPEVQQLVRTNLARAEAAPRDAQAHGRLGMIYEANLLWDAARTSYATAAQLDPDTPAWRLHEAIATREAGDPEAARALLQAVAAEQPDLAAAQQRLGDALLEAGDLDGGQVRLLGSGGLE